MLTRLLALAFAAFVLARVAVAGPAVTPLVSTDWLEQNLGAADLVILDIRSAGTFGAGHVPGALQTDYPGGWRATRDGVPWMVPAVGALEPFLSSYGIGPDTSVVIVPAGGDATELGGATWIYWVFRYLGHEAVAILDGGFAAWRGEGRAVASGPAAAPTPGAFTAEVQPQLLAETEAVVAELGTATVIVDARPPAQYAAGHIPGAINLDNNTLYDLARHHLLPEAELRALLPGSLGDPAAAIITYCNTGHWGSIDWFVLSEVLGYANVRLYDGSMSAWVVRRPPLPIETGM